MGEDDALVQLNADIAARETAGNRAWFENLLGPQFAMRRANLAHTTRAEFLARVEASAERSTDDIAVAHHTDLTAVVTCTVSMRQDDDTWGRVPQRAPVHPRRAPPHLAAARVGQRTRRQRLTSCDGPRRGSSGQPGPWLPASTCRTHPRASLASTHPARLRVQRCGRDRNELALPVAAGLGITRARSSHRATSVRTLGIDNLGHAS
jgi:hypothetical protein